MKVEKTKWNEKSWRTKATESRFVSNAKLWLRKKITNLNRWTFTFAATRLVKATEFQPKINTKWYERNSKKTNHEQMNLKVFEHLRHVFAAPPQAAQRHHSRRRLRSWNPLSIWLRSLLLSLIVSRGRRRWNRVAAFRFEFCVPTSKIIACQCRSQTLRNRDHLPWWNSPSIQQCDQTIVHRNRS